MDYICKSVLITILCLYSTVTAAELTHLNWYDAESPIDVYADFDTIEREYSHSKIWGLVDFKIVTDSTVENFSAKTRYEFACMYNEVRQIFYSLYNKGMGEGEVVYSSNSIAGWSKIGSDFKQKLSIIACNQQV